MSNRFKRGFTLIEIVFVIVIVGIVSSIVVSYGKPNDKGAYNDGSGVFHQATGRYLEAAVQVLGHIRYTQHLAMVEINLMQQTVHGLKRIGKYFLQTMQIVNYNTLSTQILIKME